MPIERIFVTIRARGAADSGALTRREESPGYSQARFRLTDG